MLEPAVYDTVWTTALIAVLFSACSYALILLPWTDREIATVHNAAMSLLFPPRRVRALARRPPG